MVIIEKIKNIFGRKQSSEEQAKPEVETPAVQPVETQEENLGSPTGEVCDICGFTITDNQKGIHKFGKAYHSKPCFKERMKQARKVLAGN